MFINNYLNLVIKKKKNYHNSQISYLDPKKTIMLILLVYYTGYLTSLHIIFY